MNLKLWGLSGNIFHQLFEDTDMAWHFQQSCWHQISQKQGTLSPSSFMLNNYFRFYTIQTQVQVLSKLLFYHIFKIIVVLIKKSMILLEGQHKAVHRIPAQDFHLTLFVLVMTKGFCFPNSTGSISLNYFSNRFCPVLGISEGPCQQQGCFQSAVILL